MADENVTVSAPEASAVEAPAQPAQGLPEGIAERAAALAQGQPTTQAPANPPVEAPAPKAAPKAAPESYGSLQEMIGDELKADPQAGVIAAMLETVLGEVDINRAFGKAVAEDDPRFIDEAYLKETLGPEKAKLAVDAAKQLLQHAERIGAQLEKELFTSVPGGEAAVKQAAAVFNQVADEPTKAAIARLLDSGDKASMQYALRQIITIATQSGKLVVHNEPGFGQPAAEKGLTRDEYIAAINKPTLTDAEYQKLRAQRALGRQQGI